MWKVEKWCGEPSEGSCCKYNRVPGRGTRMGLLGREAEARERFLDTERYGGKVSRV